jgi:DMSO/TMAO reductase YedYZ molybdopterin-dependent catalytic subunit
MPHQPVRGTVVRIRDASAGVLAVAVAIGVAELLAGLLLRVPSPLDAVGQALIPRFPSAVTAWAISTFGSANRLVLLVGTLLVAAGAGAALGSVARHRPSIAVAGFVLAGVAAAWTSLLGPDVSAGGIWSTAALAVVAGLATLRALLARAAGHPLEATGAAGNRRLPAGQGTPVSPAHPRRAFLGAAVGAGAAAVVMVGVGRYALGGRLGTGGPAVVTLPPPSRALPMVTAAQRFAGPVGLSPLFTPTEDFFRIDTALRVPRVDPGTWELRVHGLVEEELVLTYDELLALPLEEVDVTLLCVSNEVGGDLVGNARWTGVRLDAILERVGVRPGAGQVVGRAVDGFEAGFPLEAALDGRDAIVAVAMNGDPLPTTHGFPARLVVPGLYGYVSATKWLAELELTTWEGFDGYWVPRGWAKEAPVKTSSRIDVPRPGDRLEPGAIIVAGVAWAPTRGIERVDVQVDDGSWVPATLSTPLSADTWVQWRVELELPPGTSTLRVRASDGDGQLQPRGPRPPAPDGAEGWHEVVVRTA